MATALGTYATLAGLKARIPGTASGSDALLQSLCDQVNGWIESKTGRPLTPYPLIATTVAGGGAAGSQSVTLASAAGVSIGDALMLGPVSGTHEHGIVVSVAGAVVGLQWPLVSAYANGTAVSRVQVFDGEDALEGGRMLAVSNGIVTASALEVAFYTGGAYSLIPGTDWFLRPTPLSREPGWPAFEVWMTDIPSSGNPCPRFMRGIGNIRLSGVQPGWPAQPDEIVSLALNLAATLWRRRGVGGGGDSVQTGTDGARTISLLLDSNDWRTINRYSAKEASTV